ncbi:MAG: sulfatase/phosphatase domain-containing protein [Phycisphaeraceae bacterium]
MKPIRRFVLILAMLLAYSAPLLFAADAKAAGRPNIVFIFTDDHCTQSLSAYGSKINITPHMDRIAKDGMRFDYCLVTNALCGPSRATIQTGKYSHANGFYRNGNRFDGAQWTFPKALQKAGYQTAVIGKWHLESDPQGFDYWDILIGQGPYYNPPMIQNGTRVQRTGYTTEIITDLTLKWLKEQRAKDKPFMLMYQHKAPHREWQPGPKYHAMFKDEKIPEPETLFDDYEGRASPARKQDMTIEKTMTALDLKLVPPRNLNEEQLKAWHEAYDAENEALKKANLTGKDLVRWRYQRYAKDYLKCVAAVDDGIGEVMGYLKAAGLEENTIVIYTTDNGWYIGEHGWFDKRWMYEESLRVPLLVKWPGTVKPGSVNKDMVSNVDFAATMLEMAGAENPGDLHGKSLVPILKGNTPADWRKTFYYHYYEFPGAHSVAKHYGVRSERHKLIHYYTVGSGGVGGEWELFDLEKDPDEMRSVYDDPNYDVIKTNLKVELKRLQKELGETEPTKAVPGDPQQRGPGAARREFTPGKLELQFALHADKPAALDGKSTVKPPKDRVDLSQRALSVGAWVKPAGNGGVIIAQGGATYGFSLYLKDGKPVFAIRENDELIEIKGKDALPAGWSHVAAYIDKDESLHLLVAGAEVATGKGKGITSAPADNISIGADTGSFVGEYPDANHFKGELRDVRYYLGVVDAKTLKEWIGKP